MVDHRSSFIHSCIAIHWHCGLPLHGSASATLLLLLVQCHFIFSSMIEYQLSLCSCIVYNYKYKCTLSDIVDDGYFGGATASAVSHWAEA